MRYDLFICHASSDKSAFVAPLAAALQSTGLRVWYDDQALEVGDSIRAAIDRGIAASRSGIVILSSAFFSRAWPQRELDGLFQRLTSGALLRIFPVLYDISVADVEQQSPMLAGIRAIGPTRDVREVAIRVRRAIEQIDLPADSTLTAHPATVPRHDYRRSLALQDALQAAVSGLRRYLVDHTEAQGVVVSLYVPIDLNLGSDLELLARSPEGVSRLTVVPGGNRTARAWQEQGERINPALAIIPGVFSDALPGAKYTYSHYIYYAADPDLSFLFGVVVCEGEEPIPDDSEFEAALSDAMPLFESIVLAIDAGALPRSESR
ncbi:MAG TPA: toll/interleukin-1 receptor domain-containing protein [Thermoanaerobaculia bacterium]|nr:toll/interleukin-1 receptor domain-containing protein [Thermoanaerobaculia bacterium]